MPAVAAHHTETSDASWDKSVQEKRIPADASAGVLGDVYAWKPTGDAADSKSNWKFPHHFVAADGTPGAASTVACSAAVGALNGAQGGTTIPEGDKKGVYNHVIAHLRDAGVKDADLPELKSAPAGPGRTALATPLDVLREHRCGWRGRRERRHQPLLVPGMSRQQTARGSVRAQFEFRANPSSASGPTFRFEGYAATFEQPFDMWDAWGDPYFETLAAGACNRTLANGCDTQFLVGHDESGLPMARTRSGTMTLTADSTGLDVFAPSLDGRNPQVQQLASAMERGDVDEMSIGFIATAQQWSPDWMERRITEINLHRGDVSIVCWAANPNANGACLEALPVSEAAARQAGLRESRTPTEPYSAKPGETLECPQCHSMNDTAASYCDQCGTAVKSSTVDSSAAEEQTQRCPCGNWNAPDAKFCAGCGTNISSDLDADNGGWGNGITTDEKAIGYWRRGERRAVPGAGEPEDQAPEPDFSAKPAQDTSSHGDSSLTCPNSECGAPNAQDAGFCDQCGQCLYDEGGLISSGDLDDVITDASGLIEEEDMTLARLRVRVLQLRG
jgi:HK97 family phage prohead protease